MKQGLFNMNIDKNLFIVISNISGGKQGKPYMGKEILKAFIECMGLEFNIFKMLPH